MTIPKQTVEARWYLGCVFYSLMYHYVLGRTKVCLLWDGYAIEDAVADRHAYLALTARSRAFALCGRS